MCFLHVLKSHMDFRKASPIQESLVLHVDKLSRNVNEGHLKEIFGKLISCFKILMMFNVVLNLAAKAKEKRFWNEK